MSEYLLDLDAIYNRPLVKFGGNEYEMRVKEEFSIVDFKWFAHLGKKLTEFEGKHDARNLLKMNKLYDEALDKILIGLPLAEKKRLKFEQKLQILEVFTKAVMLRAESSKAAKNQTGEKLSQDSKTDTAEISNSG